MRSFRSRAEAAVNSPVRRSHRHRRRPRRRLQRRRSARPARRSRSSLPRRLSNPEIARRLTLSPKTVGKKPKQGQGHLHFSIDDGKYDQPKYSGKNGQLAVKLGVNGKYSPSVTPSITYKGLPAGKHTLEVYLANNDHSNTGVEAKTMFTVEGAAGGAQSGGGGAGY